MEICKILPYSEKLRKNELLQYLLIKLLHLYFPLKQWSAIFLSRVPEEKI